MYTRFEELIYILIFTLMLWVATIATANARPTNIVRESICDQATYDMIYSTIVKVALNSNLTTQDIKTRNDSIRTLRQLCNDQLSTYERGKK